MNFLFTGTPLKFFVQSLWRDESFSYLLAKMNIFQLLVATAKDFNPPLYYLTLKIWMTIFGSSEISMRTMSLLFFCGTLYVVYLILNEILHLSSKKSIIYMLLFAFNPLLIYYAFEARMYTMFAFFATLSFYAFYTRKITLYVVATALGLYTHYFMTLAVFTQFLYTFLNERGKPHFWYLLKKMTLPVLYFAPWLIFFYIQQTSLQQSFWIPQLPIKDFRFIPGLIYTGYEKQLGFLALNPTSYPSVIMWISLLITVLIVVGFMKSRSDNIKSVYPLFIFFLLWTVVPILIVLGISYWKPYFLPRYLIFTTIGLLLLIVMSLEHIKYRARIVFLIALIFFTYNYHLMQMKYRTKTNVGKTLKEIKALAKPEDVVYVTNELDYFDAQYYFGKDRVYIYGKSYESIPPFVGKVLMPKERFTNVLPFYPKKAFVLKDQTHYEIRSLF
jgi:mannosyltransferase